MALLFNASRELLILKLAKHIELGGRIYITTDSWIARNYKSFTAVIGHWINSDWTHNSKLLDIIELVDLIHFREYLVEKLSKIIDSLEITYTVFIVTRDNATSNNSMLDEFESLADEYWKSRLNHPYQLWSFTQKEGDIRYIGHVINLAIQEAMTQLKATPSNVTKTYWMKRNEAHLLYGHR
jgi:hypothetical protein